MKSFTCKLVWQQLHGPKWTNLRNLKFKFKIGNLISKLWNLKPCPPPTNFPCCWSYPPSSAKKREDRQGWVHCLLLWREKVLLTSTMYLCGSNQKTFKSPQIWGSQTTPSLEQLHGFYSKPITTAVMDPTLLSCYGSYLSHRVPFLPQIWPTTGSRIYLFWFQSYPGRRRGLHCRSKQPWWEGPLPS